MCRLQAVSSAKKKSDKNYFSNFPKFDAFVEKVSILKADKAVRWDMFSWPQKAANAVCQGVISYIVWEFEKTLGGPKEGNASSWVNFSAQATGQTGVWRSQRLSYLNEG